MTNARTLPVVQFTRLADWLADLEAGYVIGIWHALLDRPGFVKRMHTIVRAIVTEGGVGRIAALAFEHGLLIAEPGRPADDEIQARHAAEQHDVLIFHIRERLAEIGILPSQFRAGVLDLTGDPVLIYATHPLDKLTEELAADQNEAA